MGKYYVKSGTLEVTLSQSNALEAAICGLLPRQHALPPHATSAYWAAAERVPAVRGARQGAPSKKPPHFTHRRHRFHAARAHARRPGRGRGHVDHVVCLCRGGGGEGGPVEQVGRRPDHPRRCRARTHHKTGAPPTHSLSLFALWRYTHLSCVRTEVREKKGRPPRARTKKKTEGEKK